MDKISRVPLTEAEINAALAKLPGWSFSADKLIKHYTFKTFRDAMTFLVRLSYEAEGMDHHPEINNVYNKVALALNTHDAGAKVTGLDVELARRIEHAHKAMS